MHIHRKRLLKRSLPCPYHHNFDKRQTIPKISNFWLKNAPGGDLGHQKPRQNWGKIGPKPCLGMWRSTISANRSFLPKRAVDLDPILASLWGPKIDLKHALGRKLGHRRTIFNDFSDFHVFLSFPARFCFDFQGKTNETCMFFCQFSSLFYKLTKTQIHWQAQCFEQFLLFHFLIENCRKKNIKNSLQKCSSRKTAKNEAPRGSQNSPKY